MDGNTQKGRRFLEECLETQSKHRDTKKRSKVIENEFNYKEISGI